MIDPEMQAYIDNRIKLHLHDGLEARQITGTDIVGGASTPGGSTTQIQFNDAGAFGGDANLTWDKATRSLSVGLNNFISLALGSQSQIVAADGAANSTGGELSFSSGNGGTGNANGGFAFFNSGAGSGSGSGGATEVFAGDGGSTGNGGQVVIIGGAGGATSGNGGSVFLEGGGATNGNSDGGAVDIISGSGAGSGSGAAVNIVGGSGGTTGFGGSINITAGANGASQTGGNGEVAIQGAAAAATNGGGGFIDFRGGAGNGSGTGGDAYLRGGAGGASAAGGTIYLVEGAPGTGSGNGVVNITNGALSVKSTRVVGTLNTTDALYHAAIDVVHTTTNSAGYLHARVVGHRTGGTGGTANDMFAAEIVQSFKNAAGTVTLLGSLAYVFFFQDVVNTDAKFVVSGTNVQLQVRGDTNNNYTFGYEFWYINV